MPILGTLEPDQGLEQGLQQGAPVTLPDPAQAPTEGPETDLGVLDYAADMLFSAGSGAAAAVQETADFGHWAMNAVDNAVGTDWVPEENPIYIPGSNYESKTTAGAVTKGVSQFLTAFVGVGKFLKPIQWAAKLQKAGKAGAFAHATLQGAMADFIAFDPKEGRFSNVLKQAGIQSAVTDYLAADPEDGEVEGRFKNALEGAALGAVTEPLFMAFRSMKKAVTAGKDGGQEAAARALAEDVDELEKLVGLADEAGQKPKPIAQPGEKVEVYSEAERRIILKEADEAGHVALEPGQKFVVQAKPAESRAPKLIDYEKIKAMAARSPEEFEKADFSKVFNYDHMEAPEHVLGLIDQVARDTSKGWDDGIERHADVVARAEEMADMLGQDKDFAIAYRARLAKDADGFKEMTARFILAKKYVLGMTDEVSQLSKRIVNEPENVTKAEEGKLLQLVATWEDTTVALKKIQKGAARITSAGRIDAKAVRDMDIGELTQAIEKAGGSKRMREVAKKLAGHADNPKGLARDIKLLTKSKKFDIHNEYWINSILSGPKTHMVNMMSNSLQAAVMPMDRIVGGAVTGNMAAVKEGFRLYAGLVRYLGDALRWAGKAAWYEDTFIDTVGHGTFDAPGQVITTRNLGFKDDTTFGFGVNFLGKVFRMPSRLLGAEDEFFKQLNYRAKAYADLAGKAVERGTDAGKFIEENFEKMFTHEGMGRYKPALEYAREATFTRDLEYGLSKWMQQGSRHFPPLRLVMPFIRTPANIVRQVWQRTPVLGSVQRQLAADLASGDPVVRAAARGKQAIGGMMWTSAIMLAANGRITGGGPRDPKLRERLLETGWQPYSVVSDNPDGTKQYTQISRMDPFAMFFGVAADYVDISQHISDEDAESVALAMMAAFVNNIGSKTYLRGAIDAVNVFANPERFAERWAQRQASTYVPFSSLAGQVRQEHDPAMREVRSVLDAVRNRIPGLSDQLPAKHSWVTGEPVLYPEEWAVLPDLVSPLPVKHGKNDTVMAELGKLQHAFSPPMEKLGNIELSAEQFSELLKLHGKVRINGRTMHAALERLMASPSYDISRQRFEDAPDGLDGPRVRKVRKIITAYRGKAVRELLRGDPELRQAYAQDRMNVHNAKKGKMDRLQEIIKQ